MPTRLETNVAFAPLKTEKGLIHKLVFFPGTNSTISSARILSQRVSERFLHLHYCQSAPGKPGPFENLHHQANAIERHIPRLLPK